jgi:hypothetical protein
MMSWRDRQSLDIQTAADRAGAGWRQKLDANQALSPGDVEAYRQALGLRREAPMCYLPRGILRLLQTYGPLWVIGDDAIAGNQLAHVRIVTGIRSDGTDDGTVVRLADSDGGQAVEQSYTEFASSLEAEDPVSAGFGVFHW